MPKSNGRPLARRPVFHDGGPAESAMGDSTISNPTERQFARQVVDDIVGEVDRFAAQPMPSLPVCGFCGMSPAMIQTAFLKTPWGARLATFFCESCKAVFGVQVVAMEQPRQAEPLIMTPGEAFRP